jgi:hypothetical protein
MLQELEAGFLNGQSPEHFPGMVGIKATTGGIKVFLNRKAHDIAHFRHNNPVNTFHLPKS